MLTFLLIIILGGSIFFILLKFAKSSQLKAKIAARLNFYSTPYLKITPFEEEREKETISLTDKEAFSSGYIGKLIEKAGLSDKIKPKDCLVFSIIIGFLIFWAALLFLGVWGVLLGTIGGGIGIASPFIYLKYIAKRRKEAFLRQFIDFLPLVASSLRAGYSFLTAIDMVSREFNPPLSQEFAKVLKKERLGIPLEESLKCIAIEDRDLTLFTTTISIHHETGGNLSYLLERLANTLQERYKLKKELKTLTAASKISGIVIGLLPAIIAFILFLLLPDVYKVLFTTTTGFFILFICIILYTLGILFIRKIINIEI